MTDAIQKAREALDEARIFIAAEYADASAEVYGEWLASEARPVFAKICTALADLETAGAVGYGPYGYLLKPIGLNEEHWTLGNEPSGFPSEVVSVPLFAREPQMLGDAALDAETEVWRTMDSAPKDGTKFDVWIPGAFGGRRMTDLSFNSRGGLRQHGLLTDADLPRFPTHWRPLPSPPEARS